MSQKSTSRFGAAIALGLLFASQAAIAATEYEPLLKDNKFEEVEKLALARLAKEPANADAMIARAEAILSADETRVDEALKQAEQCVASHPNNAHCHMVLGAAFGIKAMVSGNVSALIDVSKIRGSFKKAVELNPRDFDARFALLEFYMKAPFIVGGGSGKAEALAKASADINAEGGKLMFAAIDLNDGELAKAEAAAMAIKPGADEQLVEHHDKLLGSIVMAYAEGKKFADAARVLREAEKRYPDSTVVPFVAARVQQEQGKHREALALLERAAIKTPRPHVYYRMGKSLYAMGEKSGALAAFEKAVAFKAGLEKSSRADAQEQIKALKG